MATHVSAITREQTPHTINSINNDFSDALKRRAQSVINDKSIDAGTRTLIRYGLEIDDPWLPELVRRAEAGETVNEELNISEPNNDDLSEEKVVTLGEMICRADDEFGSKSAALLVLMTTLENARHPKILANTVKHCAFTRWAELNFYSTVETQVEVLESELFADNTLLS